MLEKKFSKDGKMSQFESMSVSEEEEESFSKDSMKADQEELSSCLEGEFSSAESEKPLHEDEHEESIELIVDRHMHEENPEEQQDHRHKESKHKQVYESFLQELESLSDFEAKLQKAIEFMQASLSQNGTPHFKSFWDARSISMELFKENISAAIAAPLE